MFFWKTTRSPVLKVLSTILNKQLYSQRRNPELVCGVICLKSVIDWSWSRISKCSLNILCYNILQWLEWGTGNSHWVLYTINIFHYIFVLNLFEGLRGRTE